MGSERASKVVPARSNRYNDTLWNAIYGIWGLEARGNAARTRRILVERVDGIIGCEERNIEPGALRLPSAELIQKRARDEQWGNHVVDDLFRALPLGTMDC